MITVPVSPFPVSSSNLPKILYDQSMIKALAQQLVASQAEAFVDMVCDCEPAYKHSTFADVAQTINTLAVRGSTAEMFDDLVSEFADAVREAIKAVTVHVDEVKFVHDGVTDVSVRVE